VIGRADLEASETNSRRALPDLTCRGIRSLTCRRSPAAADPPTYCTLRAFAAVVTRCVVDVVAPEVVATVKVTACAPLVRYRWDAVVAVVNGRAFPSPKLQRYLTTPPSGSAHGVA
jgi:hypothetical protein